MEQDEAPESSPAHEVELDPDEEARRIILARRARFVAIALVSAGVGTASCGGQTSDGKGAPQGTPQPCLSDSGMIASGGAPQVCLEVSLTGGTGGMPQPCLSDSGTPQPCLKVAPPDAGSSPADAAADAPREAMPLPCLIPHLPNSGNDS